MKFVKHSSKRVFLEIVIFIVLLLFLYGFLGYFIIDKPFYSSLKESNFRTIENTFLLKSESIERYFNFLVDEGVQVISRKRLKDYLEMYNRGDLDLSKFDKLSYSVLEDAVKFNSAIDGIVVFSSIGKVLLQVGKKFLRRVWLFPYAGLNRRLSGGVFRENGVSYYQILFPIRGKNTRVIGYALIFYGLRSLLESMTSVFVVENVTSRLKLYFKVGGAYLLFPELSPLKDVRLKNTFDECFYTTCNFEKREVGKKLFFIMVVKPFRFFTALGFDARAIDRRVYRKLTFSMLFLFVSSVMIVLVMLYFSRFHLSRYITAVSKLRREIEEKNREILREKTTLENYLNMAPIIYLSLDGDGNVEYMNRKGFELLEYSREEIIGKNWFDTVLLDEEKETVRRVIDSFFTSETLPVVHFVNSVRTKSGKILTIEWNNSYIRNKEGKVVGVISTGKDITRVREEEEQLGSILESLNAFLWSAVVNGEGFRVTYYSREVESVTGYTPEELLGNNPSWIDVVYEEDRDQIRYSRELMAHGESGEEIYRIRSKDGKVFWVRNWFYCKRQGNGIFVTGFCMERTREIELEQWLERIIEAISLLEIGYIIYTAEDVESSVIVDVNDAFEKILGYSREEIVGKMSPLAFIDPKQHDEIKDRLMRRLRGEDVPSHYVVSLQRKDRRIIKAEVNITMLEINGRRYIFTLFSDVTDKLQSEENYLKQQKMEAIGVLTSGIAHDFNNILGGIIGWASLLETTDLDEEQREMVDEIQNASNRAAGLISKLLGFARRGKVESRVLDLNEEINKVLDILRPAVRKDIRIVLNLKRGLGKIVGDPEQIQQVIMNLCVNATQAMPEGGQLTLTTDNFHISEEFSRLHFNVKPGEYVILTVDDTGVGMDEETMDRIFEPFFTTKGPGEGTGLGLATVYGIVKNHGGIITVYSEKGRGTSFKVYLPQANSKEIEVGDVSEREDTKVTVSGKGTILLVDDESMILSVFSRFLERLGYRVLTAEDGAKGIAMFEREKETIDLVILDLNMPELSGKEVFKRIKEIRPEIKVILSTGFAINGEVQEILDMGANGYIKKPYDIEKLSALISEVLKAKG